MKRHTFAVTIVFENDISDENEINEIGENIAESIRHTCDTSGIAPENSETFTKQIEVSNSGLIIKTIDLI